MRIASVAFRGIWILKISVLGIVLWQGKGLELRHLCRDSSQGSLCAKMNIARSPIKTSWSTSTKAVTWLSACSWCKGRGKYIRRMHDDASWLDTTCNFQSRFATAESAWSETLRGLSAIRLSTFGWIQLLEALEKRAPKARRVSWYASKASSWSNRKAWE